MTETNRSLLDEQIERTLTQIAEIKEENSEAKEKLIDQLTKLIDSDLKDYEVCSKAYKDEELVKNEKKKVWIDNGTRLIAAGFSLGGTVLAIVADKNGWFVSKLGLGQSGKKLL